MKGLTEAILALTRELKRYNDSHEKVRITSTLEPDLFKATYDAKEIHDRDISDQLSTLQSNQPSTSPLNQEVQRKGARGKGRGE